MRLATFNMESFGADRHDPDALTPRLDALRPKILELEADILCLQEVNAQMTNPGSPSRDNPLGRVLGVYEENKDVDLETLELKMGEAILTETPDINKYISFIYVLLFTRFGALAAIHPWWENRYAF